MNSRITGLSGLAAAAALLVAGCGSGATTAATTASTTAGAGSATSASAGSSPAPTTAGSSAVQDVQLDGQTISYFTTLCAGVNTLDSLQSAGNASSPAELGTVLSTAGGTITQTADALTAKQAPTFAGGDQFAARAQEAMSTFGGKLTEFGQRASALQPGDAAAAQQFVTDFQQVGQELQALGPGIKLDPAVEKAVVEQVPGCDVLASSVGAGGSASSASAAAPSS